MDRRGQRFLLALTSLHEDADKDSENLILKEIFAGVAGALCLVFVFLMCACKGSGEKEQTKDMQLQQTSQKREKQPVPQAARKSVEVKSKMAAQAITTSGIAQVSETFSGHDHLRHSISSHVRPTNGRELPAPPIPNHKTQHKVLPAAESPRSTVKGVGSADHASHQDAEQHHSSNNKTAASPGKKKLKPHYYDHLGPKLAVTPSDYDSLAELKDPEGATCQVVTDGDSYEDDDYSHLEKKTFPVVIDVRANASRLFDPHSKVKDKDDSTASSFIQMKEEDPYNHIGDSDGTLTATAVHRLKLSHELDNPYEIVQDDSAGQVKGILDTGQAVGGTIPKSITQSTDHIHNPPSTSQDEGNDLEEYAVVNKPKVVIVNDGDIDEKALTEKNMSVYSKAPPEPPRLYSFYDNMENTSVASTPVKSNRKHKYSQVTARESLASLSARTTQKSYTVLPDQSENTYAMVEGWSGEGTEIGGASGSTKENRLSQISDTYAEIGTSGDSASYSSIDNSGHIVSRLNPASTSADWHNQVNRSETSKKESVDGNSNHFASAGHVENSFNTLKHILEYEDSAGNYVTLKEDSFLSVVTSDKSGKVTLVPNNQMVEDVDTYPDYETVDETRVYLADVTAVNNILDTSVDSVGNKKVGQRRRRLDKN